MLHSLNKEIAADVATIMVYAHKKDGIRAVINNKDQRSSIYKLLAYVIGLPTEERTEQGIDAYVAKHAEDAAQVLARIEESWKENVARLSLSTLLQLLKTPADKSPEKKMENICSQKEIGVWNKLAKAWLPHVGEGVVSVQYTREKCMELIQANADNEYANTILTSLMKSISKSVLQKLMKGTFPQLTSPILGKLTSEEMKVCLANAYNFDYQPPVKRPRFEADEEEDDFVEDEIDLSDEEEIKDMDPTVVELAMRLAPKKMHTAETALEDFKSKYVTEYNVDAEWPITYAECVKAVRTFLLLKNKQFKETAQDYTVIATLMSFPRSTYEVKHNSITTTGWMTKFNSDMRTWNSTNAALQEVYKAIETQPKYS